MCTLVCIFEKMYDINLNYCGLFRQTMLYTYGPLKIKSIISQITNQLKTILK